MNTVTLRGLTIGQGRPKIVLPLVGETLDQLRREAEAAAALPIHLVEWRVDWFRNWRDPAERRAALALLRERLGDRPILATFRTAREGGQEEISLAEYDALLRDLAACGGADLVDIEAFSHQEMVRELTAFCRGQGIKTVLSNHDFRQTPPRETLVARLRQMEELGGDLLKIAVMPQSPEDVLTLLSATQAARRQLRQPLVTMSMGPLGAVSRVCGETFGSALTFGAGERASAPGQIPAGRLAEMLDALGLEG